MRSKEVEESIKDLKDFIKYYYSRKPYYNMVVEKDICNMEKVLNYIKELENGEVEKTNLEIAKLEYKIVELEKEIERQKEINIFINHQNLEDKYEEVLEKVMTKFLNNNIDNDFISKQVIRDKIEELEKEEKKQLKGTKGQDRYLIKQEFMYKRNIRRVNR